MTRGISLLSTLGKALDKLVYNDLRAFVVRNSVLDPMQSAYRTGFGTETALVGVLDKVRSAMDRKEVTILVMVDFSAAFDLVRRDILLAVLQSIGIVGTALSWCSSYLSERLLAVKGNDGELSAWEGLDVGTPQGSVLSALCFVLYITSLPKVLSVGTRHMSYADDLQLFRSCRVENIGEAVQALSADLGRVMDWCSSYGMDLNLRKTKAMIIGYPRILGKVNLVAAPKITFEGIMLEYVHDTKMLGVVVQDTLGWELQTTAMCRAIFGAIYQLRRTASDFPTRVRLQLVQSLILPHLDYAAAPLCDLKCEELDRLQKAQNAALRFALRLKLDEHVTAHYHRLGWLKMRERKRLKVATLMFKVLKTHQPAYLYDNFEFMTSRDTRNRNKLLVIPRHRTAMLERSFLVQGAKLYNDNVDDFDFTKNVGVFKKNFKEKLLKQYE